jgi:hypothetical protein
MLIVAYFGATWVLWRNAAAQIPDQEHLENQITVTRNTEYRVRAFSNKSQLTHTFGGRENLVSQLTYPLCRDDVLPEVRLSKPPSHGTVRLVVGKTQPLYCPNLIRGIVLFYKPAAGFVGRDKFTVERKGDYRSNGLDQEFTFVVTVK